jgi:hypothetical protein
MECLPGFSRGMFKTGFTSVSSRHQTRKGMRQGGGKEPTERFSVSYRPQQQKEA